MSARQPSWISARLVMGIGIAVLGGAILLDNLELADARLFLRFFWPAFWITLGAALVANHWGSRTALWGGGAIAAGLWLLADRLELVDFGFFELALPAALLALGGTLVWRALEGRPSLGAVAASTQEGAPAGTSTGEPEPGESDVVKAFALMSGYEKKWTGRALRAGDLSAVMGGVEIDLRGARTVPGGAVVEVFAFWGGVVIKVPESWRVDSEINVLLGGYEDKTRPAAGPPQGRLVLRGLAVMGGVEVSN